MKFFNKKNSTVQQNMSIALVEPPKHGFDEFKTILSDWVVIRFAVPCHVWNELAQSKEWKAFQTLLEKHQTEYIQKQRSVAGCQ